MKVQISAVIITLNEERNIGRCLESIVGVADEIVVVDSYSTDQTRDICLSYGARFIQHRFVGHIEQKNWALLQAKYPFVLSLDADEALSDQLQTSIRAVKENWSHDAYYFNRLTNYCGQWIRHTSWYPSRKLRLWDTRKGSWGGVNPHDRFQLLRGASKRYLKGDLLHYSYYSISEHVAQINSFSSIMARSYYQQGRRPWLWQILLHPMWRFIRDFVIRLGFLDGHYGFVVSANSAHEVFLKYEKLRSLYREEKRKERKSICFFNSEVSWGGGEKWNFDVASDLAERAYPLTYLTSPGSPLSKRLSESGLQGHSLKLNNLSFINPVKIWRIARILRQEKVAVLISNLSGDMKVASLAAKLARVPGIIYRRGSALPVRNTILNRYLFRRVLTQIIANSQETKRTILAKNPSLVPESKIRVIYNGIHLSPYTTAGTTLYQPAEGEIVLGSAGRFSGEKGHVYLLELMKILSGQDLSFTLLIAGEGKLEKNLQDKAKALGVNQIVKFLGFVEDMPAFFRSIDIFLLTSLYEGFGYVLAEAMASRVPVVSFDIRSSQEIILDGDTGFITPSFDVQEMSHKVMEVARNQNLREKMGEMGRKRVKELFSFRKSQEELIRLLDPFLQKPHNHVSNGDGTTTSKPGLP